jgi:hypothetical protein
MLILHLLRGPYLASFLPCLINQKIGHRVMLRIQTEDLPSRLHDGSGKNGIVDVQPMARVPLPIERGRCINNPLIYGRCFKLREKEQGDSLFFRLHKEYDLGPLHRSHPEFVTF